MAARTKGAKQMNDILNSKTRKTICENLTKPELPTQVNMHSKHFSIKNPPASPAQTTANNTAQEKKTGG